MRGRAFVSGVESPQAVKPQRQSPAISSLGQSEGESNTILTATAMTAYRGERQLIESWMI